MTDKEGWNREMRPEGQKFVVLGSEIKTYHIHQKESKCFFIITLKSFVNFHHIRDITLATNSKWGLKLSTSTNASRVDNAHNAKNCDKMYYQQKSRV